MPVFVSDRRLYLNVDRSKVVEEGDEEAAFLLVPEGGQMSEEDAQKYGLRLREHKEQSAIEREEEALAAAEARGATDEARTRRANLANLQAEEDAQKAQQQSATKMRAAAPANKAAEPPRSEAPKQ